MGAILPVVAGHLTQIVSGSCSTVRYVNTLKPKLSRSNPLTCEIEA